MSKKTTIEKLEQKMEKGFARIETNFENLAGMVNRGFQEVDKRFENIGEEMRLIKGRLDSIEMELSDIRKKLENVIYRDDFYRLEERITELEKEIAYIKKNKK